MNKRQTNISSPMTIIDFKASGAEAAKTFCGSPPPVPFAIRLLRARSAFQRGFSLIESLLSLCLFLFILLAGLDFVGMTQSLFIKLKQAEEESQAAYSALEKIRIDLLHGGFGLALPMSLGIFEGVESKGDALEILQRETTFLLSEDLVAGQTKVALDKTGGLRPGREVCVFDGDKGETIAIASVQTDGIILSSPLDFFYAREEAALVLIERISYFFDKTNQVVRRQVNGAPPQPLLEDVLSFGFAYDKATNLARVSLFLPGKEEKTYEVSVFPKNIGLVRPR